MLNLETQLHPLNVVLVAFAWGPSDKGGLLTHVREIAKSLTTLGHKIFIHCVDTRSTRILFETKSWCEGDIHIQAMNY